MDNEVDSSVRIHFDVTFPYVDCAVLTMDVMDENGRHNEEVTLDNVHKTPLSSSGELDKSVDPVVVQKGMALVTVGDLKVDDKAETESKKKNKCGDCYGAHGPLKRHKRKNEKGCCNSCTEIRMAYEWEGWKFDSSVAATIPLCEGEVLRDTVWNPSNSKDDTNVRGCNVKGFVDVCPSCVFETQTPSTRDINDSNMYRYLECPEIFTSHRVNRFDHFTE